MLFKVRNYLLILCCLIAVSTAACQSILYSWSPDNTFSLVLQQRWSDNEELEKYLLEALTQKIQSRGYGYKSDPLQARWKLVLDYQYSLAQTNVVVLNVRLSLYDPEAKREVWNETASASALRRDALDKLVDPVTWSLANRFPYAPDYGGVGVVLSREMKIINFSNNSPAQKAGLRKNDQIVRVDQEAGFNYEKCQQLLYGRAGTKVEITVRRDEQEQSFKVARVPMKSLDQNEAPPVKIQPLAIDQLKKKLASP